MVQKQFFYLYNQVAARVPFIAFREAAPCARVLSLSRLPENTVRPRPSRNIQASFGAHTFRLFRRAFSSMSLSVCLGELSDRRRCPSDSASFQLAVAVCWSWRAVSSPSSSICAGEVDRHCSRRVVSSPSLSACLGDLSSRRRCLSVSASLRLAVLACLCRQAFQHAVGVRVIRRAFRSPLSLLGLGELSSRRRFSLVPASFELARVCITLFCGRVGDVLWPIQG